jgi:hypothetical protein
MALKKDCAEYWAMTFPSWSQKPSRSVGVPEEAVSRPGINAVVVRRMRVMAMSVNGLLFLKHVPSTS